MPKELFFIPEKKELENVLLIWQALACIEREEDCGNYEKAKETVDWVLNHAPFIFPLYEGILQSEAVFLDSLLSDSSERTDKFYEKLKKINQLQNIPPFQRASYAYFALYKKDSEKAQQALENLRKTLKKIPLPADFDFEQRQLQKIESILSANLENGKAETL